MKTAIYPGSFNPWHEGHEEVLQKALKIFDKVIIARGFNPDKFTEEVNKIHPRINYAQDDRVVSMSFNYLLADFVKDQNATAVIKGLRNGQDLEYEKSQQYWNEDLGLTVPVFYIISSRELSHVSSSAIRAINKFKKE